MAISAEAIAAIEVSVIVVPVLNAPYNNEFTLPCFLRSLVVRRMSVSTE